MAKERNYASALAPFIEDLIASKRACGFSYESEAYTLERLDRFCASSGHGEATVTAGLAEAWAEAVPGESGSNRESRMGALRQLALHMRSLGIDVHVPRAFSVREAPTVYLPTPAETRELFAVIDAYRPSRLWYMADGYRVAFRLMRCCGLRISECSNLATSDVDCDGGRLLIRHSKGEKDRVVYMADDLASLMHGHLARMRRKMGFCPDWAFPGIDASRPILKNSFCNRFAAFWRQVPGADSHARHPTPHCLRHAFVVDRMNAWMAEGRDLGQMMPYLAAYLGHAGSNETFYYYHQVDRAFAIVRERDDVSARVIPEVTSREA